MKVEILADAPTAAHRAAEWIAAEARAIIAARGRFVLGVSGGATPARMLRRLAAEELDWSCIDIVQVDERIAPAGHAGRNLTSLLESLRDTPPAAARVHPMPVEAVDLADAQARYAALLESLAGTPPVLDVAHLGLGTDGHTASLIPGDPVLDISDAEVACTREYMGWRRMTLTFPSLNRARRILWLVTGAQKTEAFSRLLAGDRSIPAGRIERQWATALADRAAAGY